MTVDQVIEHYGGIAEVARKLSISYQAVQQWVDKGAVPEGRQWQIQALSGGSLVVDAEPQSAA